MPEWLEVRKKFIDELCRECTKEGQYKIMCPFRHNVKLTKEKHPCKYMPNKAAWRKLAVSEGRWLP